MRERERERGKDERRRERVRESVIKLKRKSEINKGIKRDAKNRET